MSYDVGVKQIYMNQYGGHESSEKPALCLRGRKHTHCVVIDYPVRVLKKPLRDFDTCRDTMLNGSIYPVKLMISRLREIAKRNGITVGATRVLETALSQNQLDEEATEEIEMEGEINNEAKASNAEETKVSNEKVKKAKKSATKKAGKKAAKPVSKKAAPAKKTDATKKPNDGLGREGTVTRLICEMLVKGESNEKILKAARAKFPDNKILDSYPGWYRNSLVKKGVLKASK